jgi:hypothetical protein
MKKIWLSLLIIGCIADGAVAQGTLSGDLQMNVNFFQKDSKINADSNALYDNYLSGGEGWLTLRYNYKGFTAFARLDAFHNSNLRNPTEAFTAFGVGAFSLSKEIQNLTITGGYIYDQIGSGILFRAYEDRGLLIDNALVGLHLKYRPTDFITLKAFAGQQKMIVPGNVSGRYEPIIKGFNAEADLSIREKVQITPGIGVLNRTLDQNNMSVVTSVINDQPLEQRFIPHYNMYAFTAYNTLTYKDLSWYVEGAYKTNEAISINKTYYGREGTVFYSTLGYARKGLAVNLTGKRTENFVMRTSPKEELLNGMLNWQPVVARLRPQRLIARYTPASQDVSEAAGGIDVLISPKENLDFTLNYTHMNTLEGTKLFREAFAEVAYRSAEKFIVIAGAQYIQYNQELYQSKPLYPIVEAITPFAEVTYRITPKKSIRIEAEYQHTEQDFGSWAYLLVEYNIAPRWSFTLADMYNVEPRSNSKKTGEKGVHYPYVFAAYSQGPHRVTIAYVKQTEGINCTGGVCRYEPAFSGVRLGITSNF